MYDTIKRFFVGIAIGLVMLTTPAMAQVVTQLPAYLNVNTITDLGNGPLELRTVLGNAWLFTAQGSGTGTATTTALTLTATPATPPIVGGFISCNAPTNCSIPANTTVTAFNGTTGVTLSATATITAAQVNWGAACPAYNGGTPPYPALQLQVGLDLPLYTQSRICGYSNNGPGAQILTFPIGAH